MDFVTAITEELLALDPALASDQKKLTALVQDMIAGKPAANMRPDFQVELLERLRTTVDLQTVAPTSYSFFQTLFMQSKILFTGLGAIAGAAIVLVMPSLYTPVVPVEPLAPSVAIEQGSTVPTITIADVNPTAFGALQPTSGDQAIAMNQATAASSPQPMSNSPFMAPTVVPEGAESGMAKMIAPPMDDYMQTAYVYEGDITLPTGTIDVFKRSNAATLPVANSMVAGFAESLFNWSLAGPMRLQNVNIELAGSNTYSAYIDYLYSSISLNRIYSKTEHPQDNCTVNDCWNRYQLTQADMISDEQVIATAKEFARTMNIDTSAYSEPIITDNWQIQFARTTEKSSFYFPEQMYVTFPLLINNQPVYEEYGKPYGLTMSIDVRTNTVASMSNLIAYNFDRSAYAAVRDEQVVRDALTRGGVYGWLDPTAKKTTATTSEPLSVLMHTSTWDQSTQTSTELFVPALAFKVSSPSENIYDNREFVVVPLVQELYDQNQDMPIAVPYTEPAIEPVQY
jgi:hypothetical protein